MEKDFCKKCGKCCSRIKINTIEKVMYRNGIEQLNDEFLSMLKQIESCGDFTYFCCKFLKDCQCTNQNKPDTCKNYPSSPFSFLPEDCGYEGVIFQKQELLTQKIRRMKEEIIHYEALIYTTKNKAEKQQYAKIIKNHEKFISQYEKYGAENW